MQSPEILSHPRFVETNAERSAELRTFADGIVELQAINPEIVGATLFGSMLKGEAKPESDIDCTVFVDADVLEANGIRIQDVAQGDGSEHPSFTAEYADYVGTYLAAKMNRDPSVIRGGVYVRPISKSVIDARVEEFFAYAKAYDKYEQDREVLAQRDDGANTQHTEAPEYTGSLSQFGRLFNPDVSGSLDRYREYLLDRLAEAGEYGERGWEDIISYVKFGEGHMPDEAYPRNVQEALAAHHRNAPVAK